MSLRYGPTFYRHARNQLRLSEIKLCKFPAGPKLIQNGTSALNARSAKLPFFSLSTGVKEKANLRIQVESSC
jgi:hypothetical protein